MPDWIHSLFLPPLFFVTNAVKRPMMGGAEGHRPLVADLAAQGAWLGKSQVMSMARGTATDETGLCGDNAEMRLVAYAPWGADPKSRLVDLAAGAIASGRFGLTMGGYGLLILICIGAA